jgi:hypothetical protein
LTENKIAALVVGAMVGCEDRPNDDEENNLSEVAPDVKVDDDSADEVDTDVEPAWLPEVSEDECGGGALELPLLLDALALDP